MPPTPAQLDATFAALADPTRRAILARLATGEASVDGAGRAVRDEPAGDLQAPQGAGAGRPDLAAAATPSAGPRRIEARPLQEANMWIERYRELWEANYQRLDGLLAE